MATTTTSELGDTIPTLMEEAKFTQQFKAVMRSLSWNIRKGKGSTVNVPYFGEAVSRQLTEGVDMTQSETMTDTNVQVTPYEAGLKIIPSENVVEDDNEDLIRAAGRLLGDGYEKKVDQDLLARLDNGTTSLGGAETTLTMGHIAAARAILAGNATSAGGPAPTPYTCVIHPFTEIDIVDVLTPLMPFGVITVAGTALAGMQSLSSQVTDEVLRNYSIGRMFGMNVVTDGNLSIDASGDAKGGVFASGGNGGIIYVSAREPKITTDGGGGYDASLRGWELNYVGRYGVGNYLNGWTVELYMDAATPS